ncbi:MAG: ExbD/TolR family protein [Rickettsiales bacterium]
MDFVRTPRRKMRALNLTPLIDVFFILIVFFMLTTTFMRIESMELILPSEGKKATVKQEVVRLFVHEEGNVTLGQRTLKPEELSETLSHMLDADPDIRVMLLTADGVSMQQLVNVMDRVYMVGGKSLMVRKWIKKKKGR